MLKKDQSLLAFIESKTKKQQTMSPPLGHLFFPFDYHGTQLFCLCHVDSASDLFLCIFCCSYSNRDFF